MARGRKPNGGGSIYQRASDNKWVGATYVLTTDGTRRRKVVYGTSWEEAHAKLLEIQDRDRRGLPAPHDAPTVAEYLDYWLEQIVHVARRPATYAKYESMVRVHIARTWATSVWTALPWATASASPTVASPPTVPLPPSTRWSRPSPPR